MSKKSFNDTVKDWETLVNNLTPMLPNLPNLAADHATLSGIVTQTRAMQDEQESRLGALRKTIEQRNLLAAQARKARNRLVAGLQSAFDHASKDLVQFGIRPRIRQSNLRLTPQQKADHAAATAAAHAAELAAASHQGANPATPPATAGK